MSRPFSALVACAALCVAWTPAPWAVHPVADEPDSPELGPAIGDYYAILDGPVPYAPIARAAEIRVPMLIERGGRDMPEVNEPLKRFLDAALTSGVNLELLNHPAGEHAFDIVTDDARTRQIIARTLAFLRDVTVERDDRNRKSAEPS